MPEALQRSRPVKTGKPHSREPDAVARARELLPLIVELRHVTEANRLIAAPIVEQLRETRLGRMAIARELHGLELPTTEWLDVHEALAGAEPSVAWIVLNNSLPCFFGRFLDNAARRDLFGDAGWLYACSTRPSGKAVVEGDGFRLSGRWALVSGCELAEWISLACIVEEGGQPRLVHGSPEIRLLFVRRGDFEILDTWNAGGMRGTGSHDVVVNDLHVPRRWSVSPGDPSTLEATIGRIPITCTMAAGFSAQTLGIARQAVATLVDLTRTKVPVNPGPGLAERPDVMASVVRHSAALAAARDYLHARAAALWNAVDGGASPTLEGIGAVWAAAHHAIDAARQAVDAMYAAGGTSSLYVDCPLERAHRDLHAMLRHVVAQPLWIEDAGRVRAGLAAHHPLYAV
jgi:alkylation response protein AidB-like acyl-CoA dehydrogenase